MFYYKTSWTDVKQHENIQIYTSEKLNNQCQFQCFWADFWLHELNVICYSVMFHVQFRVTDSSVCSSCHDLDFILEGCCVLSHVGLVPCVFPASVVTWCVPPVFLKPAPALHLCQAVFFIYNLSSVPCCFWLPVYLGFKLLWSWYLHLILWLLGLTA